MFAGARSAWDRSATAFAALESHINFDGGITARIQNLARM
jgi:hypothetical protein